MDETKLIPTTVVGSYPQPDWLIDRARLKKQVPARVRVTDLWRIPEPWLEQAQDDATVLAIREMERAGIDIISDGEMRRESYSNRFANALGGVDRERLGAGFNRRGGPDVVPLVSGPVRRIAPVEVRDLEFLRTNTNHQIKITLPGPFTMTRQAENAYYADEEALAMAYAEAVNLEIRDLFAAGADVVQLDEPYMDSFPEAARRYAVTAINRALQDIKGTTVVHLCFGYGHYVREKTRPIRSFPNLTPAPPIRSRSKQRNPNWIWRSSKSYPPKRLFWACLISAISTMLKHRTRSLSGCVQP